MLGNVEGNKELEEPIDHDEQAEVEDLKVEHLRYTIINGDVTFEDSLCTNATLGKLVGSYDMVLR